MIDLLLLVVAIGATTKRVNMGNTNRPRCQRQITALSERQRNLSVVDCIADRIRLAVPQPTEWEHIGDQIDAAMIFTRSDFVNVVS
jgi:hypothetical protein